MGGRPADVRAAALYRWQPGTVSVQGGYASPRTLHERSLPLAFGLSAVVPGAGQAYNKQWVKAVTMVAAEVAMGIGYFTWRANGRDGVDTYEAFAVQHWSPIKYANWINDYATFLEDNYGAHYSAARVPIPQGLDFTHPEQWSDQEVRAARMFFDQIRAVEKESFFIATRQTFSHRIPYYGTQQFYELIGKYFQFSPGWFDFKDWRDAEGNIIPELIDPERTIDGKKVNVSDTFFSYAEDHADANTLLRRASRISAFIVINHIVSAIDAAVFARVYNRRIEANVDLTYDTLGRPQPRARLAVTF